MIDSALLRRLEQLEGDRAQLAGEAARYRLASFNLVESLVPQAAKFDMALAAIRFARAHLVLTATVIALAGFALRRRIGMFGIAQLALNLGNRYLAL
jgi:hypothetical protein